MGRDPFECLTCGNYTQSPETTRVEAEVLPLNYIRVTRPPKLHWNRASISTLRAQAGIGSWGLGAFGARSGPIAAGSAVLLDADEVAGGVADGEVTYAPVLVHWFLHHLGVGGLNPFERAVQVVGREEHA
jgi:hypothetical protein